MHNAIVNNASLISLRTCKKTHATVTLEIMDNCPGGLPSEYIKGREGRWGLTTVQNTLIPRLGPNASISFESPLTSEGGTRILVTVPVIDNAQKQERANIHKNRRRGLVPPCAFRSMDPFAVGGTALIRNSIMTSITLP
jgi:hypothetical protein